MVSADNLNLDVLELIFACLSGKDLAAVALVSTSFLAAVIPHLYRNLSFRTRHAKKYPKISSSFSSILAHPALAVHVKNIDVRDTPVLQGTSKDYSPFIRDCGRVVDLCVNLESFTYTKDTVSAVLPMLQGKNRLKTLRLHARLTTEQAEMVVKLNKVQKLTLDYASWNMLDLLPKWIESIHRTLTTLTVFMSTDLNRDVLEQALLQLPHLTGLHVVGCPSVDHITLLKLAAHTPNLESLSFTATELSCPLESPAPPLYNLRDLTIDLRPSPIGHADSSSHATVIAILSHLKAAFPPLSSLTLKVPDLKPSTSQPIVKQINENYSHTLRRLSLVDCTIGIDSLALLCTHCIHLEHLSLPLPVKDILSFTHALTHSSTIHTIIDADAHIDHGPRASVKREDVKYMMGAIHSLRKVVSEKRIWTGRHDANRKLHLSFEAQNVLGPSAHWFMPASR